LWMGAGEANGFEKFFAGLFSAIGASSEQVHKTATASYKTVTEHVRQSRPDSGLGLQLKVLIFFEVVTSSLGSGWWLRVEGGGRGR